MDDDVKQDMAWADRFTDVVNRAIKEAYLKMIEICKASAFQDNQEATDCIIKTPGSGETAIRLRRGDYHQNEITIRYERKSGVETEYSKIRRGMCKLYLFGWVDNRAHKLRRFVFVDLDKMRNQGFFDKEEPYPVIPNSDGKTSFTVYTITRLAERDCIIYDSNDKNTIQKKLF